MDRLKHIIVLAFLTLVAMPLSKAVAQEIDRFNVGPYIVEYMENGEVKYHLRTDIDLYKFYGLHRDTIVHEYTIVQRGRKELSMLRHGVEINALGGINPTSKEVGLLVQWKQQLYEAVYFNIGAKMDASFTNAPIIAHAEDSQWNTFEGGLTLGFEYGEANYDKVALYASVAINPMFYSMFKQPDVSDIYKKKDSGLLVAPELSFGFNLPADHAVWRLGLYITYKVDCTKDDLEVYKNYIGRTFAGARIGVVF